MATTTNKRAEVRMPEQVRAEAAKEMADDSGCKGWRKSYLLAPGDAVRRLLRRYLARPTPSPHGRAD